MGEYDVNFERTVRICSVCGRVVPPDQASCNGWKHYYIEIVVAVVSLIFLISGIVVLIE